MKKFLSLLLTLALALTLAVPALAVDVNSPDYKAGFEAGYQKGYDEGYDEGYMDGSGYEPTEYAKGYSDGWEAGYDKGLVAGADAAAQHTYTEQSLAEGPEDFETATYEEGYAEGQQDGFACGYDDGFANTAGIQGWEAQELMDKGGVLGQVNVLYNDECIQFTDAAPKIVNSRTMLPIRAVSEGMGKIVDWDPDTRTVTICEKDVDASVIFAIGSQTATVYRGEDKTELTMDCAPFIENGRTMVPVRFLSEALGYTVLWDSYFRTVVVVDADAVAEAVDADFTKFNEMAAKQRGLSKLGEQVKLDYSADGALTMYDETGKATDYKLGMDFTLSTDSKGFRVDATLDLKSLVDALTADPDLLAEDAEVSLKDLLSIDWSAVTATILMDESGHMWMNVPALNVLALDAGKDAWVDLGSLNDVMDESGVSSGLNLTDLFSLPEDATMGQVLVTMCSADEGSFYFYQTLNSYASLMEAFYGDSVAKGSSSSCTWTLNVDQLLDFIGLSKADFTDMGYDFDLSCKTSMDTRGSTSLKAALSMSGEDYSTISGSLDVTGTSDSGSMTLKAAMADFMDLTVTMKFSAENLDKLPAFAPPAGAEILTLDDLAFEDVSPVDGE